MTARLAWTRQQLLVAFYLYCQIPFGELHSRNPEIIKYAALINRTPSALAMKLSNIASLDPAIISTGRKGLKGASAADKTMWQEMQQNWGNFAIESSQAINSIDEENSPELKLNTQQVIDKKVDYTGSNKVIQSKARVGQNFFRKAVLSAYNYRCCITGLSVPSLLIASHIIPWREDAANRLNPSNGLALSMLHDKAFDIGLITINEDMTVRVSQQKFVTKESDSFYYSALQSYAGKAIFLPEKFLPHVDFLAYHREVVFEQ
ncbi:MAG: HNH endonuclease [Methyloprofundus sp.]|nr:HNH endonuclease [Methyloprofundus sp.]